MARDLCQKLRRWLNDLPEKHQQILCWRFGHHGDEVATLADIGARLGDFPGSVSERRR
ncbi:hypothetical protein HF673_11795 [Acidithiobacillus thiooxidans]|uniref:sigma factor-like helix-turn-helix DNA-binding protein n=1 Tax=Acidithiobacillus thiooxidans TaxID=930 RepID=UPI001C0783E5|nr:hypothetical protein [Acidithiobacillus thiooxidans]